MMKLHAFVGMVARLSASGDPVDPDGDPCPNGFEHDTGDSLDALDEIIHKARAIVDGSAVPPRNFTEGEWSFRRVINMRGKVEYGVSFDVYPKGQRSRWSRRLTIEQNGACWLVHAGYTDAFASWPEAKAHALKRLAEMGRH